MDKTRVIIMGAAGRDFHNFNTFFRDNDAYEVVAFTATQIPGIEGKTYPPSLAGSLYPRGIPIHAESELDRLVKEEQVDRVVFSYSDVPHEYVMHKASQVLAVGADYWLLGPNAAELCRSLTDGECVMEPDLTVPRLEPWFWDIIESSKHNLESQRGRCERLESWWIICTVGRRKAQKREKAAEERERRWGSQAASKPTRPASSPRSSSRR